MKIRCDALAAVRRALELVIGFLSCLVYVRIIPLSCHRKCLGMSSHENFREFVLEVGREGKD
jgi:hypothetical protein